ncbi:MAG: transaldolase [Candidatus Lokiarchaeota archaeon]|nr:transaldolase [Candidatus Lokiarchaeota archaeon]
MKYFLDSGKIEEIRYAYKNWAIDGVTTNPKHIKNSGKTFKTVLKELADEFKDTEFPISVEINPHLEKAEDMIKEAKEYSKLSSNFVIKVPCTEQGLIAAKILEEEGVRVNVTLIFSASQAIQAARINATFISPFIGWQEASGVDCATLLEDIMLIVENYGFSSEVIVAALRNGKQIVEAARLGADIVTAGFEVYNDSFDHPFTDRGLKIFQDAWDSTPH